MTQQEKSTIIDFAGVSIVAAVRNEAEHLDECLRAVVGLDYPHDLLEVILVDGHSTDRTVEIITHWSREDPRIKLLQNAKQSASSGMNIGINTAKFDFILWTSGHALLAPDHIKRCYRTLVRTQAAAVGGVLSTVGTTAIGRINAAVLSHPFGVGGGEHRVGGQSGWVPVVTMALYRKSAILEAGGFDESLPRNQDNELHHRMNKLGHRSYLDTEVRPTYLCRNTVGGLLKQAWKNGFWNVILSKRGHGGLSLRHFVPMSFVGLQVLLFAIGFWEQDLHNALFIVLALYALGAIASSLMVAFRNKFTWQLLLLPIWFAGLHYTYGFASWAGLITIGHKKKN